MVRSALAVAVLAAAAVGPGCGGSSGLASSRPAAFQAPGVPIRVWPIQWQANPYLIDSPSPDGRFVLLLGGAGPVVLRLAEPAGPVVRLDELVRDHLAAWTWSPDSRRLVVLSEPRDDDELVACVLDLATSAIVSRFYVGPKRRENPTLGWIGGTELVGVAGNDELALFDSRTGARVARHVVKADSPRFSPRVPLVAFRKRSDDGFVVVDARSGRTVDDVRLENVVGFAWSQSSVALAAYANYELAIWRPPGTTLRVSTDGFYSGPVWGEGGRTLALRGHAEQCEGCMVPEPNVSLVIDTRTAERRPSADFRLEAPEWVALPSHFTLSAHHRAFPRKRPLPSAPELAAPHSVEWTSERTARVLVDVDEKVDIDVTTGRVVRVIPKHLLADERELPEYAECGGERYRVVRSSDGSPLGELPFPCSAARPTRVGRYFAGAEAEGTLLVDATGRRVAYLPHHAAAVESDAHGATLQVSTRLGERCARLEFATERLALMPLVDSGSDELDSADCISGAWGVGRLQHDLGNEKSSLFVWSPERGRFVPPASGVTPRPFCMTRPAVSPRALVCIDGSGTLRAVLGGERRVSHALGAAAKRFAWSPDQSTLAIGDERGVVHLFSVDGAVPKTLRLAVPVSPHDYSFTWSSDGRALVVETMFGADDPRRGWLVVLGDGAPKARALPGNPFKGVLFGESGRKLLVNAERPFVVDIATGVATDVGPAGAYSLLLSRDDRTLFLGGLGGNFDVIQIIREGKRVGGGRRIADERGYLMLANAAGDTELWSHDGERVGTLPPDVYGVPYLSPSKELGLVTTQPMKLVRLGTKTALLLSVIRSGSRKFSVIQSPAGWFSGDSAAFETLRFARGSNLFDAEPLSGNDVLAEFGRPEFLAGYLAGRAVPLEAPSGVVKHAP
jgi:hypothetical protein